MILKKMFYNVIITYPITFTIPTKVNKTKILEAKMILKMKNKWTFLITLTPLTGNNCTLNWNKLIKKYN